MVFQYFVMFANINSDFDKKVVNSDFEKKVVLGLGCLKRIY